jgi:hypothetical protein
MRDPVKVTNKWSKTPPTGKLQCAEKVAGEWSRGTDDTCELEIEIDETVREDDSSSKTEHARRIYRA